LYRFVQTPGLYRSIQTPGLYRSIQILNRPEFNVHII
jgi:hypothetical protein